MAADSPARPLGTTHPRNPRITTSDSDVLAPSLLGMAVRWSGVVGAVVLLLLALALLADATSMLSHDTITTLVAAAAHPVVGLCLGIAATAVVQSSTTITTVTVAAVATGVVPLPLAIAIIMGANIGTSVTSAIVALSFMRSPVEFRRAFAAAHVQGIFNTASVAVLFPFELVAHPLERASHWLTSRILSESPHQEIPTAEFVRRLTDPVVEVAGTRGVAGSVLGQAAAPWVVLVLGAALLLGSVYLITRQLHVLMAQATRTLMERALGDSQATGVAAGAALTALIHSSSTVTSSIVPFAAVGSITTREALSLTLGANIGTTLTTLMATLAVQGPAGTTGLEVALVHVLFNLLGVIVVMLIQPATDGIIHLADWLAGVAQPHPGLSSAAVLAYYLVLPGAVVALYVLLG
ncbi:Na+/Pi-cotransporter [Corynebacterium ciconiae DSM 44920]|uniref:Na/Pi symporter n=1 Tax=Corynebacterium ciconiae TaxID=227319 RepID=UPI00035D0CCB|nr:Na/Pi symporter [Corynebacterium ciconiae]WKD61997.1 Na+/Pi-cotransporter [Corynebacterium ciconiae DSM 44920]